MCEVAVYLYRWRYTSTIIYSSVQQFHLALLFFFFNTTIEKKIERYWFHKSQLHIFPKSCNFFSGTLFEVWIDTLLPFQHGRVSRYLYKYLRIGNWHTSLENCVISYPQKQGKANKIHNWFWFGSTHWLKDSDLF